MKRIIAVIVVSILTVCLVTGCSKEQSSNSSAYENQHKELKADSFSYEKNWINNGLTKAGINNLSVGASATGNFTLSDLKGKYHTYLFIDNTRYGSESYFHETYLAVETGSRVLLKDLLFDDWYGSYEDELYARDVTGDGKDEIILQQLIGMTGGYGQYLSRIFEVISGEIKEIFCSYTVNGYNFNTGFSSRLKDGLMLEISNKFTGYSISLDLSNRKEYYVNHYDETGKLILDDKYDQIMIDSFFEFVPQDSDKDGIFEIKCAQYVSLIGHADHIGDAESIIKYNPDTRAFEVIKSEFKINTESNLLVVF